MNATYREALNRVCNPSATATATTRRSHAVTTPTTTTTGIRCANRAAHGTDRVYHATTDDVRACFAGKGNVLEGYEHGLRTGTAPAVSAAPTPTSPEADRVFNNGGPLFPATEKQLAFLRTLANDRSWDVLSPADRGRISLWLTGEGTFAKGAASDLITALKAAPYKAQQPAQHSDGSTAPAPVPSVPDGRYALTAEDGATRFYRVNTPTEGRWARFTFVDVQASDELHPIRNRAERTRILEEIAKDPKAAMLRYGKEIGSCGHCGRTLTNDESRKYGIGPICRGKMGW